MRRAAPIVLLVLLVCSDTRAHRGSTKLIVVERTEQGATLEIELEAVDAAVEIGLPEDASVAQVMRREDDVRAFLERGIRVRSGARECEMDAGPAQERERDDGPRIVVTLTARCPAGALVLHDDTIFPNDDRHEAFVRIRWTADEDAHVLRRGRQTLPLGDPPSVPSLLGRFAIEGGIHLVTGYDHLLFLLALVLTAGGLAAREGLKVALKDVAWLVTAFTIGHSVTLIAAALGWVILPSRLVESVIAGSIAVVAILNIARPRARKSMPWLAFGFGLVHGFGFSGVLAELGLPAQARVLSLVAFNVGIELAQLAFVALLLYPLAQAARLPSYEKWFVRGGSSVIALVATYWLIERAFFGG